MAAVVHQIASMTDRVDPSRAGEVLAAAVDQHAFVSVRAKGEGFDLNCRGALIARSEDDLSIQLTCDDSKVRALFECATVHVVFEVGGARYMFDASEPLWWDENEAGILHLSTPATLAVADRRRSPRRRLKHPTTVMLESEEAAEAWTTHGAMLNLSADGMACRIGRDRAAQLAVGQIICVVFRLPDANDPLRWAARVTNTTEAGTPDQTVVGLEFVTDKDDGKDRERLRRAVEMQC